MQDSLGREIEYLRISVTQSCNLNCIYCMPNGKPDEIPNAIPDGISNGMANGMPKGMPNAAKSQSCSESISAPEIGTLVNAMSRLGIKKVRVTGGEPLIRRDICDIISAISSNQGIEDISLTTNGILLGGLAKGLKEAGLKRVNVSLDSLKEERFKLISGGGELKEALEGLEAAIVSGILPIRINTVLIKGINDDEIDDFILLAKDMPIDVRFIELMPIGKYGEQNSDKIVSNSEIISQRSQLKLCEVAQQGQPATYYRIDNYRGRIGFISPISHKFCHSCNRIRITCDGKIRPCLGQNGEESILSVLREKPERLENEIRRIIYNKPKGHNFENKFASSRSMNMIGG